ncbi:MAG: hydrogenase expression/formation protein HypE [Burkholderiaceae bacterium]|nr:hydrogenase expression/formation protein HypE [Burkholderiaceae bacterium]
MIDEHLLLAHGNGGRLMRELIDEVFGAGLGELAPDARCDAALLPAATGALMVSTDGFTVQPLEFPGGDLGTLAAHGTINDLAVAGAKVRWLTLGAILEEGLEVALLRRLVAGFAASAGAAGARIVAGDTKLVPRGNGGGAYFSVTGIGECLRAGIAIDAVEPGDAVLVSGPIGDHGIAVMLAREDFDLQSAARSDCASVLGLCEALWPLPGLRFTRDPTRGGLATVAHEIVQARGVGVRLQECRVPVREAARSVCEMLGYDPMYLACEGRVVAVVAADQANEALRRWRATEAGRDAEIIGAINDGPARVVLETAIGGERVIDELEDDPLPRIC